MGVSRKSHSLKTKRQFYLLLNDSKLLIIALPYLLLSYTYFLYTLTTVLNSSCTEDIQLYREVWLVLNILLRFCEISFSIPFFIKTVKLFGIKLTGKLFGIKLTCCDDGEFEKDPKSTSQGSNRRSILYSFSSGPDPVPKPVGSGETNYHCSDLAVSHSENYPTKKHLPAITETKNPLSSAPNLDVEIPSQSSQETSRLYQSIDSDRFMDASNFSDKTEISSNTLDGKALAN